MANLYEPAALIADKYAAGTENPIRQAEARCIAHDIRALPNPPSEFPVFTGDWVRYIFPIGGDFNKNCKLIANAINARLATFRPAPASDESRPTIAELEEILKQPDGVYEIKLNPDGSVRADLAMPASEPDLERMQEAVTKAWKKYLISDDIGWEKNGAKYLAAEGFRLGEPAAAPTATPFVSKSCGGEFCTCGAPATKKIGEEILHDDPQPMRHNLTAYVCDGCFNAIFHSIGYLAQSRIDAAVQAEREALRIAEWAGSPPAPPDGGEDG